MRVQGPARFRSAIASVLVLPILASCEQPTAVRIPTASSNAVQPSEQATRSIDEAFLGVSQEAKSFAGAYFDDEGVLVVRVASLADSAAAWAALREALVNRVRVDGRVLPSPTDVDMIPKGRRVEPASVSFRDLYDLKQRLSLSVFDQTEVISLDLDEKRGRIVVGMTTASNADAVTSVARLTSAERALVEIQVEREPTLTQQLIIMRHRPLSGGYQIGPSGCTMTATAWRGSEQLLITASHCTASAFQPDGGPVTQNNAGVNFGYEVTDPAPYSCGTLFNPKICRRSDAAAYNAAGVDLSPSDSLGWAVGRIARTTYSVAGVTLGQGSTEVDSTGPYWNVVAEIAFPLVGEVLHKVGVNKGWTYGPVYETCKDIGSPHGVRVVCQDKANIWAQGGDSGSPVFKPYGGYPNTIAFYGVTWAHDGGASGIFSNLGQMKQDLGNIVLF